MMTDLYLKILIDPLPLIQYNQFEILKDPLPFNTVNSPEDPDRPTNIDSIKSIHLKILIDPSKVGEVDGHLGVLERQD